MTRLCLLLSICLLLMTGCALGDAFSTNSVQAAQDNSTTTKSFQSPALSFNYPGSLHEKKVTNGSILFMATSLDPTENPNNLTIYDVQELIVLNVIQKIQPEVLDVEELRQANLKDIQQLGKVRILVDDELLQDSIPVLEYTLSSPQGSLHIKQYFHCTKKSDTLVVSLSTPEDNWDNLAAVVQTLEQSLKFK